MKVYCIYLKALTNSLILEQDFKINIWPATHMGL